MSWQLRIERHVYTSPSQTLLKIERSSYARLQREVLQSMRGWECSVTNHVRSLSMTASKVPKAEVLMACWNTTKFQLLYVDLKIAVAQILSSGYQWTMLIPSSSD